MMCGWGKKFRWGRKKGKKQLLEVTPLRRRKHCAHLIKTRNYEDRSDRIEQIEEGDKTKTTTGGGKRSGRLQERRAILANAREGRWKGRGIKAAGKKVENS